MVDLLGFFEENIDVENFVIMFFVSDFLDVLNMIWGKWSLFIKFVFKWLIGKKYVLDVFFV